LDLEYFLRHLDPAVDSYISQNRFFLPCRRIAYLVQADALFTDLDYYATELRDRNPRYIFEHALMLLDEANIPPPTLATATGRGVALVWLHTPIPRRALPRWKACQRTIYEILRAIGADRNALDAARVLRLVGTRNSRSGTLVETISGVGDIWDFDTLATEILPLNRDEIREKRRKREEVRGRILKPPAGFSVATLWASRLDDFEKLVFHRFGALRIPSGNRDLLMLLYGVGMSYLVESPQQLRHELVMFASDVCGWAEHETKSRLSTVLSRAEAAARGVPVEYLGGLRDPRYRYKDATLVEMLGVTEKEMRALDLRHLVTDEIKRERDRERKVAKLRAAGAVPRGVYLAKSLARAKPWEQEGISRRTWERRRARNGMSSANYEGAVASPSGCMVAEPKPLGDFGSIVPATGLDPPQQPLVTESCGPTTFIGIMQAKTLSAKIG